MVSLLIKFIN